MDDGIKEMTIKVRATHTNTSLRGWLEEPEINTLIEAFKHQANINHVRKMKIKSDVRFSLCENFDKEVFIEQIHSDFRRALTSKRGPARS